MEQVLFIVWRESVEALLVVGILYTWLRAAPQGKRGLAYLWAASPPARALAVALALVLLGICPGSATRARNGSRASCRWPPALWWCRWSSG